MPRPTLFAEASPMPHLAMNFPLSQLLLTAAIGGSSLSRDTNADKTGKIRVIRSLWNRLLRVFREYERTPKRFKEGGGSGLFSVGAIARIFVAFRQTTASSEGSVGNLGNLVRSQFDLDHLPTPEWGQHRPAGMLRFALARAGDSSVERRRTGLIIKLSGLSGLTKSVSALSPWKIKSWRGPRRG